MAQRRQSRPERSRCVANRFALGRESLTRVDRRLLRAAKLFERDSWKIALNHVNRHVGDLLVRKMPAAYGVTTKRPSGKRPKSAPHPGPPAGEGDGYLL